MKKMVCIVVAGLMALSVSSAVPTAVTDLVVEMKQNGAGCMSGTDSGLGLFVVARGCSAYRDDDVSRSRELAEVKAKKMLAETLGQVVKARDVAFLHLTVTGDVSVAKAFVSSVTEASVDQYLRGVQIIASGKNADGEMEVFMLMTTKIQTVSPPPPETLQGWVKATGCDIDRKIAEKNALRSAVEQVAGTMVVGKVSVNEREDMHKRLATTAGALVEEYRVVKESKVEVQFCVEVLASVSKRKLYDNYKSFFKCLDNPAFFIKASDPALRRAFSQYFVDKGMDVTTDPVKAHYIIQLNGKFEDRPTPGSREGMGTMLNLSIEITSNDDKKRVLLLLNERKAKDSAVLTREQRMEFVSNTIFEKIKAKLDQALHDMIVRMLDEQDAEPEHELKTGTEF